MAITIRYPGDSTGDGSSSWAAPDYSTIRPDADMVGGEDYPDWPGPPLVMPAGLLPDGLPYSNDDRDNATRICGVPVRSEVEADNVILAYWAQQAGLRDDAGIDPAYRDDQGLQDTPAARAAIIALHQAVKRERAYRKTG